MKIEHLKDPLSGLGSLENGGRYNFKGGFEAVYLAPDPETTVAEGSRDKYLIPPSVLISIEANLQKVIDLEDRKTIRKNFYISSTSDS
ncbi:MAG: RES domain-containing protein [Candidatus Humimicrobiaceae bacterium]